LQRRAKDEGYKPEELLSVRPVMTGVVSGIVIKEGAIAVRFSSVERFRLGVTFVLHQWILRLKYQYKRYDEQVMRSCTSISLSI